MEKASLLYKYSTFWQIYIYIPLKTPCLNLISANTVAFFKQFVEKVFDIVEKNDKLNKPKKIWNLVLTMGNHCGIIIRRSGKASARRTLKIKQRETDPNKIYLRMYILKQYVRKNELTKLVFERRAFKLWVMIRDDREVVFDRII